jgi:hypothetical protein
MRIRAIKAAHKALLCIVLSFVGLFTVLCLMLHPAIVFPGQNVPQVLAENYFGKQFSLSTYAIHSAEFTPSDGAELYIAVSFDVKPKDWAYFDWNCGNGEEGQDGWLVNKLVYIRYAELGPVYLTVDSCTGI